MPVERTAGTASLVDVRERDRASAIGLAVHPRGAWAGSSPRPGRARIEVSTMVLAVAPPLEPPGEATGSLETGV